MLGVGMYYLKFYTIPAKTAQTDPFVGVHEMVPGIICRVDVGFTHGTFGLTHVQIFRHEHQLYPTTPGYSFAWDNYVFSIHDNFPLIEVPFNLSIRAWNEDNTYDHAIFVGVELEPLIVTSPGIGLSGVMSELGLLREE